MGTFYRNSNDIGITTDAPVRRRVGHEVELGGTTDLAEKLIAAGLAPPGDTDYYEDDYNDDYDEQCDCDDCRDERGQSGYGSQVFHEAHCDCEAQDNCPIHVVEDCTAEAGEFKIGGQTGVLYGSDRYYEAVDVLCTNAQGTDANVSDVVGSHVHVDRLETETRSVAAWFHKFEEEILYLAAGDLPEVRNNQYMNGELSYSNGHWNSNVLRVQRNLPTFEFRIWNSSLDADLIKMSAGVSVAIVEAAHHDRSESTFMQTIAPFVTAEVMNTVRGVLSEHISVEVPGQQEMVLA